MDKPVVYPGHVAIATIHYCYVVSPDHSQHIFIGPWQATREDAIKNAKAWLDEKGFVHPLTHKAD